MQKTVRLMVVSAFLLGVSPAICQSVQGSGENSSTTSTQSTNEDHGTDWGLAGLLGLLGLLGLRKQDHRHDDVPGKITR